MCNRTIYRKPYFILQAWTLPPVPYRREVVGVHDALVSAVFRFWYHFNEKFDGLQTVMDFNFLFNIGNATRQFCRQSGEPGKPNCIVLMRMLVLHET